MARQLLLLSLFTLLSTLAISLLLVTDNISCLPNIRILVNNENLQSPPYLLETIKQVEANESREAADQLAKSANLEAAKKQLALLSTNSTSTSNSNNNNTNNVDSIKFEAPEKGNNQKQIIMNRVEASKVDQFNEEKNKQLIEQLGAKQANNTGNNFSTATNDLPGASVNSEYSLVKEETVEEVLDDEQQQQPSISRLPFEGDLIVSGSGAKLDGNYGSIASADNGDDRFLSSKPLELIIAQAPQLQLRKPTGQQQTLPVTNAHLKKPANLNNMDDGDNNNNTTRDVQQKSGGAKSLITASVAQDDEQQLNASSSGKKLSTSTGLFDDKMMTKPNGPPDTWEPNQIMQGVTNASLVPATITKEYGQHSRTRITLGGGYVRDRLPPLVNPSSANYNDDKPEKPVAPLESTNGNNKITTSNEKGEEISRVIEIPERIVLPESVLLQKEKSNSNSNQQQQQQQQKKKNVVKLDSRCPQKGVTTFEHPTACDKYFYCEDGVLSEETCPNGLMYGTRDTIRDYCVHRWKAVCDDKTIPNPISSPGCRWQFGIFNVQGSPKCSPDFYECSDGLFQVKKCSIEGQVYDDRTKSCQFAEQIGCAKEALADFQCPPDDQANTYWPFPRYFLNERALIHCINDKPEIIRCTSEERVDPEHLHCVPLSKLLSGSGSVNLESRKIREKKLNTTATTT